MPRPLSTAEIADFRDRLCEAAAGIFAEKGIAGFTMRELAGRVGVSPMTPYRYFKDKDEILAAVRARAFDAFAEALEAAYAAAGDAMSRSNASGRAYVAFALAHPEAYHLMFDIAQPAQGAYPDLARAEERARATMTRHLDPLIAQGVFAGDPVLIGHVFWIMLHGAVSLKLAGKLTKDYGFEKILEAAFRALSAGFSARR